MILLQSLKFKIPTLYKLLLFCVLKLSFITDHDIRNAIFIYILSCSSPVSKFSIQPVLLFFFFFFFFFSPIRLRRIRSPREQRPPVKCGNAARQQQLSGSYLLRNILLLDKAHCPWTEYSATHKGSSQITIPAIHETTKIQVGLNYWGIFTLRRSKLQPISSAADLDTSSSPFLGSSLTQGKSGYLTLGRIKWISYSQVHLLFHLLHI